MKKTKISDFSLQHYFLFAVICFIFFLVYLMLKPYLNSIVLGVLLSFLFMPLHTKFLSLTKGKKNLSAFLSSFSLAFLVLIPAAIILTSIIFQGINSFDAIYKWFAEGNISKYTSDFQDKIIYLKDKFPVLARMLPETTLGNTDFEKQILNFFSNLIKWLMGQGRQIAGSILNTGVSFFMMMVVFFVMIRDQDKIIKSFFHIIPLKQSQELKIVEKTRILFKSVILGNIFTSLAQGAAGGIGFAIAGFPALFWGAVIALASLIPVVGTALIWVPASIWLFISGKIGLGIFLVIWFVLIVGLVDNVLRPVFMKSEGGMGPVLIFFSILGGINVWGLLGLIYGPMVFGLGFILIYIYEIEFSEYLQYQDMN
ncbi:MAG: AI-2E family transporter [Desulfobacteraceae bacterium]|nr:AI-2E family transporter [Desulfobacteraceae bacterium]